MGWKDWIGVAFGALCSAAALYAVLRYPMGF